MKFPDTFGKPRTNSFSQDSGRKGFTFVELIVALVILTLVLLPLVRHFTSVRRVSLAARDSVVATSHLLSCLSELQALDYKEINNPGSASYSLILERIQTPKVVGPVTYETSVVVTESANQKVKTLLIETSFKLPGVKDEVDKRKLAIQGFVFAGR